MRTKTKLTALITATAAFSAIAFEAMPATFAKASETTETTSEFYMEAGAAVNLDDDSYGGIRWTTNVKEGYNPFGSADAADVTFGAFVVPTATYEAQKAEKEIAEMDGAVKVKSGITAADALEGDTFYTSAIKYDDIIADYEEKYGDQSEEQIAALLAKAYQMELTAVSYAEYDGAYAYAEATETSRSARQVANTAILVNDSAYNGASGERKAQVASYVETGATNFTRTTLTNANEGYLDLTELSAEEVTAQEIDVSAFEYDFSNVAEVLLGGKKIDYGYADGVLSVNESSEAFKKTYDEKVTTKYEYNQTWLSVFTTDGDVYSLPLIPADGVIRTVDDLNDTFGMNNAKAYGKCQVCGEATDSCTCENGFTSWYEPSLFGYYVLGNDLVATTEKNHTVAANHGGTTGLGNIEDITGGFRGTFDGRGRSIRGLNIQANGLFDWTWDASIRNVAFLETTLEKKSSGMVFANRMYNTVVENVYIAVSSTYTKGGSVAGIIDTCTFKNFIAIMDYGTSVRSTSYSRSAFSSAAASWENMYGNPNTFENAYVICKDALTMVKATTVYDAHNWAKPESGSSTNATVNVLKGEIKRYLSVADMIANVYYNEDGTKNDAATKTDNDWTAFDGCLTIDTENGAILWNGAAV